MATDYSRRQFLSGGLTTTAGLVLVGGGAGGLLAACGGTAAPKPGASGQVTGRTSTTPRRGGTLRMGLVSDFNSFAPTTGQFDTAGLMYASTVFDTLMAVDAQGNVQPYLCQSMTPNADRTVWTMTLRPGVTFHDGSPLTSAEVANALNGVRTAGLTGPALTNLNPVTAKDAMTVELTTKTPWPALPYYFTGQAGYVPSPKTIATAAGGLKPVGTGPFIFEEWVPGSHFYARRNPNYWQKGMPYVDRVEYSTITDSASRQNSLLAGTIDIMHSADAINLRDLRGRSSLQFLTDQDNTVSEPSMSFSMINTDAPVVSDLRVRQALAYGTDNETYQKTINFGLYQPAYGLFPGNPDYAESSKAYPRYDPARAKQLVADYEKDKGKIVIEYSTTNDPRSGQVAQFVQQQWQALGMTIKLKQVEQVQLITNALQGAYQVSSWGQFAAADPDVNYIWWSTPTAAPIGSPALNFARNKDPQVQAALDKGRTSLDKAERLAAYQKINERFAVDLPYLFANRTVWGCWAKKNVQNFNGLNLPDGQPAVSFSSGVFYPMSTWLSA